MDEQILHKTVTEKYRLDNSGTLTRLTGGEKNIVYKISNLDVVVRVHQPTASIDCLEFEHKLRKILSEKMPYVVKPLCYEPGMSFFYLGDYPVSVEPFISGVKPTRRDCMDLGFCHSAGNILGQLHSTAAESAGRLPTLTSRVPIIEMDPFCNQFYDWDAAVGWLSTTRFAPELPYMKNRLEDLTAYIKKRKCMPFIPIHGDYYKGNLLWDGKDITGVIDFDDAMLDWAEYEIAKGLWEFTRKYDALELDRTRMEAFLNGYSSSNSGVTHDMELYMNLNKLIRLHEILATAASMVNGGLIYGWTAEDDEYHWNNLLWSR